MHRGLACRVPSAQTLGVRPHSLPLQLTSFVGREREMDEIKETAPGHASATLTGIGGTARRALPSRCPQTWSRNSLAASVHRARRRLSDPALVPQAVASVLGVLRTTGRSLSDLAGGSSAGEASAPHLWTTASTSWKPVPSCRPPAAERAQAQDSSPRAACLWNLGRRNDLSVPPLALPDPHQTPSLLNLTQYEAVRLFHRPAVAVQPNSA